MIGGVLGRLLIGVFGYIYPAYECYKAKEGAKKDPDVIDEWLSYWLVISLFTVAQTIGDMFLFWIPFYTEMKLAFVIYCWHPNFKGANLLYSKFIVSYLKEHEEEIDANLESAQAKVYDKVMFYYNKAIAYAQELLVQSIQYVSKNAPADGSDSPARGSAITQEEKSK